MKTNRPNFTAVDLFAGCGGLSEGMRNAKFDVLAAFEIDPVAAQCYRQNHPDTILVEKDIRRVEAKEIKDLLVGKTVHLLAGCPPCQGFSSIRKLNKPRAVRDSRNALILEYLRFVRLLKPLTIMMENVPGLEKYYLFRRMVSSLRKMGYQLDYKVVNLAKYGVPQNRRRLVLVGSRLKSIKIAPESGVEKKVVDAIGRLESYKTTKDPLHRLVASHTDEIKSLIRLIPKNGGSRKDLPRERQLKCHKKKNVGFSDVYGRLRWDDFSTTITRGCLNPSKGRFLHPEENRVITPREAALLQTFPRKYKFPTKISKAEIASLIGNALPPRFSLVQSRHIRDHIEVNCA